MYAYICYVKHFSALECVPRLDKPVKSIYHEKLASACRFSCFLHESKTHEGLRFNAGSLHNRVAMYLIFLQARFPPGWSKKINWVYFDDFLPLFDPARGSIPHLNLNLPEDLVRPPDNRLWNPGQLGHLGSVALVCGAGHYRPQEGYRSVLFFNGHVIDLFSIEPLNRSRIGISEIHKTDAPPHFSPNKARAR